MIKIISHILIVSFLAFISTALPLPLSPIAIYVVASIGNFNPLITIIPAVIVDTITAYVAYKVFLKFNYENFERYTKRLSKLGDYGIFLQVYINVRVLGILSDEKTQKYINKYGVIALFLAAATPLPFTAILYASGVVKYKKPTILVITVFIGRIINYTLMFLVNLGILSL